MNEVNRILDKMGTREEEIELIRHIKVNLKFEKSEEFKLSQKQIIETLEAEAKRLKENQ